MSKIISNKDYLNLLFLKRIIRENEYDSLKKSKKLTYFKNMSISYMSDNTPIPLYLLHYSLYYKSYKCSNYIIEFFDIDINLNNKIFSIYNDNEFSSLKQLLRYRKIKKICLKN